MVASLKGNAKITIPENAKPGEEIEVQGITFDADQADFERALRGRLDQAKRQAETEKAELTKTIEELKGNAPKPDEQLKLQVERLSNELSSAKLERRIEAQLKAANMADLPDALRNLLAPLPALEQAWLSAPPDREQLQAGLEQRSWQVSWQQWEEPLELSLTAGVIERWLGDNAPYRSHLIGVLQPDQLTLLEHELQQRVGWRLPQRLQHQRLTAQRSR